MDGILTNTWLDIATLVGLVLDQEKLGKRNIIFFLLALVKKDL